MCEGVTGVLVLPTCCLCYPPRHRHARGGLTRGAARCVCVWLCVCDARQLNLNFNGISDLSPLRVS